MFGYQLFFKLIFELQIWNCQFCCQRNFTLSGNRGATLTCNTGCISANLSDHLLEGNLLSLFSITLSDSLSDNIYRNGLMTYNSWHSLFVPEINLEHIPYSISSLRT